MTYRDDLTAAHARIEALEAELERVKAECALLRRSNEELEADAKLGREVRAQRDGGLEDAGFDEDRLREKMRREEAEVAAKIRERREAAEAEAKIRESRARGRSG